MNELKLRGKICQIKKYDWGCKFAINFYAGKDKNGDAMYAFIDCKGFKIEPKDREIVEATGWLSYEKFSHDGKNFSRLIYVVTDIKPYNTEVKKEEKVEEPFLDDDLNF